MNTSLAFYPIHISTRYFQRFWLGRSYVGNLWFRVQRLYFDYIDLDNSFISRSLISHRNHSPNKNLENEKIMKNNKKKKRNHSHLVSLLRSEFNNDHQELTRESCITNSFSQISLDLNPISVIWIPGHSIPENWLLCLYTLPALLTVPLGYYIGKLNYIGKSWSGVYFKCPMNSRSCFPSQSLHWDWYGS